MSFAALQISTNLSVQVCSYPVNLGTWENPGPQHRILWRCSIVQVCLLYCTVLYCTILYYTVL